MRFYCTWKEVLNIKSVNNPTKQMEQFIPRHQKDFWILITRKTTKCLRIQMLEFLSLKWKMILWCIKKWHFWTNPIGLITLRLYFSILPSHYLIVFIGYTTFSFSQLLFDPVLNCLCIKFELLFITIV